MRADRTPALQNAWDFLPAFSLKAAQAQESPEGESAAPAEPGDEAGAAGSEAEPEETSPGNRATSTETSAEREVSPGPGSSQSNSSPSRAARATRGERGREANPFTPNRGDQGIPRRSDNRRSRRSSLRRSEPAADRHESTNGPHGSSATKSDYGAFRIITERNIFDTTRSPRAARAARPAPTPAREDSIALVGTLSYEKGQYAFFEGSSRELTKVLTNGQRIAGYQIKDISRQGVELAAGTNRISLAVGGKLRREGEEWQATGASERTPPEATPGGQSTPSTSSGNDNDIVLRLMRQRAEQLK